MNERPTPTEIRSTQDERSRLVMRQCHSFDIFQLKLFRLLSFIRFTNTTGKAVDMGFKT